ncbi:MAG: sugar nucleotide-binding protein [Chloroflexota bacterium]
MPREPTTWPPPAVVGAKMVHVSTNEVFSGELTTGYEEWMPLCPRNSLRPFQGSGRNPRPVNAAHPLHRHRHRPRRPQLHSCHSAPGAETGEVRVVTDEVGNPTYVNDLAAAIGQLIETGQFGTYHFTNAGACSRPFANEILRCAELVDSVRKYPSSAAAFGLPSSPPPFGALHMNGAAIGITLRPWQDAVAEYLATETTG